MLKMFKLIVLKMNELKLILVNVQMNNLKNLLNQLKKLSMNVHH